MIHYPWRNLAFIGLILAVVTSLLLVILLPQQTPTPSVATGEEPTQEWAFTALTTSRITGNNQTILMAQNGIKYQNQPQEHYQQVQLWRQQPQQITYLQANQLIKHGDKHDFQGQVTYQTQDSSTHPPVLKQQLQTEHLFWQAQQQWIHIPNEFRWVDYPDDYADGYPDIDSLPSSSLHQRYKQITGSDLSYWEDQQRLIIKQHKGTTIWQNEPSPIQMRH